MKGTHGLVPYTGVMPIEITLDHTGPMTRNVRDSALLLEVLAGPDGLDPRQGAPKVAAYTQALDGGGTIYVCGDGSRMEPDVRRTFLDLYRLRTGVDANAAETWFNDLAAHGRYVLDVWANTT